MFESPALVSVPIVVADIIRIYSARNRMRGSIPLGKLVENAYNS
jgi:hypothetical protein